MNEFIHCLWYPNVWLNDCSLHLGLATSYGIVMSCGVNAIGQIQHYIILAPKRSESMYGNSSAPVYPQKCIINWQKQRTKLPNLVWPWCQNDVKQLFVTYLDSKWIISKKWYNASTVSLVFRVLNSLGQNPWLLNGNLVGSELCLWQSMGVSALTTSMIGRQDTR